MIFLAGPHCAGKTTTAELLASHNFAFIDLGPTLRRTHREKANNLSFRGWLAEGEAQYGCHFTDDLLVEAVQGYKRELLRRPVPVQDLVICGSRSLDGVSYIAEKVKGLSEQPNVVVWIEAPEPVLWRRYCEENREISRVEFEALLKRDRELGLDTIKEQAEHILVNDGATIEVLGKKVNELFFGKLGYSPEGSSPTAEGVAMRNKERMPQLIR